MPVVEYKHHISHMGKIEVPGWVMDRGYWFNPADHTYLGWVLPEADREYLIPDTVDEKTKAQCAARALVIHHTSPFTDDSIDGTGPAMDSAAVTTMMNNWYDTIAANNA